MRLNKLLGLLFWSAAEVVFGLDTDAEQPVYIDSDNAIYDEKAEISTYTGNVIATQGSIRIDADKLVVYLKDGNIVKLVATGNPSHFEQLPAEGKEKVYGEGLVNEFYPEKNLLIFMKKASVRQGDAKQSSDYIEYDTKNSLLKAGEKNSDGKRVHSVIKPRSKTKE